MKIHKNSRFVHKKQQGVALVAVMLTLLLVTAMAAAILILGNTETSTSSNFKDEQKAFFGAKAGLEEARDRLRAGNSYTITYPTTLPGNGTTGVLYITNPLNTSDTVAPWNSSNKYVDDEICLESYSGSSLSCTTSNGKSLPSGTYYTSTTANSAFAPTSGSVLDWKWVRVTLKQNNSFGSGYYVNGNSATTSQVYWNGNSECVQTVSNSSTCNLPVYVLTALAVTASGSRRMLQMEVARDQLNFTAPAALTLDGTNDLFSGGTANGWAVVGTDTAGCGGSAGSAVPAVGVSDGTPPTTTTTTTTDKHGHTTTTTTTTPGTGDILNVISGYSTGSGIPSKNQSSYTGLSAAPDVENVSSTYTSDKLDSVTDISSLVSTIKNDVTQPVVTGPASYSGGGALFNSSSSSPQIVYVNGDFTASGSLTGYGILVVTGNVTFKGNVTWNGLILAVGNGNFQTDGTDTYNGAIVVANTSTGSIGSPTFNVNGGGNGSVNYSSGCIAQATQLTTFHSVSFRELIE
jgi:Tfp pilus assembly protein PilX